MIIVYCKACLPTKVVLGYGDSPNDVNRPHNTHPKPMATGLFGLGPKDWQTVFVDGDDTQTKANIVSQFGDKIV